MDTVRVVDRVGWIVAFVLAMAATAGAQDPDNADEVACNEAKDAFDNECFSIENLNPGNLKTMCSPECTQKAAEAIASCSAYDAFPDFIMNTNDMMAVCESGCATAVEAWRSTEVVDAVYDIKKPCMAVYGSNIDIKVDIDIICDEKCKKAEEPVLSLCKVGSDGLSGLNALKEDFGGGSVSFQVVDGVLDPDLRMLLFKIVEGSKECAPVEKTCEEHIATVLGQEACYAENVAAILGAQGAGDCPAVKPDLCDCAATLMNGVYREAMGSTVDCEGETYLPVIVDELLAAGAGKSVCKYTAADASKCFAGDSTSPASTAYSFVLASAMASAVLLA